jgi:hypothetical protein
MASISPDTWTAIGTIGLATVAFAALAIEPARRWIRRPELVIQDISGQSPDFLRIKANVRAHMVLNQPSGEERLDRVVDTATIAYYIQLHVGNRQGRWRGYWQRDSAEDVEVYMESIQKYESENLASYPLILPQNLCWAYMEGSGEKACYYPKIPAGSKRPCSLCGYTRSSSDRKAFMNTTVRMQSDETYKVMPGRYMIRFTISAKNAKSISCKTILKFSGDWYDNAAEMWQKGLSATIERT